MLLGKYKYCALLKTTDAELKGYRNVKEASKDVILPIFELTRSRRSSRNTNGSISKRIDGLKTLAGERPLILDLTTHQDLQNAEIASLFDPRGGFLNWTKFLEQTAIPNVIPCIHLVEGVSKNDVLEQVNRLADSHETLAFRADANDPETMSYFVTISSALSDAKRLIVIIDVGFIEVRNYHQALENVYERIGEISLFNEVGGYVCLSSSFPQSPAISGENSGELRLNEVFLSQEAIKRLPEENIIHGDYALVHPNRYESMVTKWVPRIDVPLDEICFYHRYKRDDGGYVKAAKYVMADSRYSSIDAWGDEEIKAAAKGTPNGRSPSHWISVRVNLHLTRQGNRLSK